MTGASRVCFLLLSMPSGFDKSKSFYCDQNRVLKASFSLNNLAWNNKIRLFSFYWLLNKVMINRNSWGHLYLAVRGEILRLVKDKLKRKHLSRMFSLIKNES